MKLITLAKAMQPFIDKHASLEAIYDVIRKHKQIPFRNFVSSKDIVKIIFLAKEIERGGNPELLIKKLETDLFSFNIVEFATNEVEIPCADCAEDGSIQCHNCRGSGYERCDDCNGSGEEEFEDSCDTCLGDGEIDDEPCPECGGDGTVIRTNTCDSCGGEGDIDCSSCRGGGTVPCDTCEGDGYITSHDYVPFTIKEYVSYDSELLDVIRQYELRNQEINDAFWINKKETFMISSVDYDYKVSTTEYIDPKYEESAFFLNVDLDVDYLTWNPYKDEIVNNALDDNVDRFTR